jgi:uncharacterized protein (DUF433 family)
VIGSPRLALRSPGFGEPGLPDLGSDGWSAHWILLGLVLKMNERVVYHQWVTPGTKSIQADTNDAFQVSNSALKGGGLETQSKMTQISRITMDPAVMGGRACIRGLRVTVGMVVGPLAAGRSREEILKAYPYLEAEDIVQALAYAAWRIEEREVDLVLA